MREERLRKTEQLLREAARWEPEQSAPERLAQRALAAALQQRPPRRRVSGLAVLLAAVCGGGALSAALSGTLLMVGAPSHPAVPAPTPKATLARFTASTTATSGGPEAERAVHRPAQITAVDPRPRPRRAALNRGRHRANLASRAAPSRQVLPRAIWHTEEVRQQKEGVIAPAVLVEPDPSTGSVYLSPTLVDIPLPPGSSACSPAESIVPAPEAEPAGGPEGPQDPEGERR